MTNGFQLVMPLDCEVNIEKNAPVRLLNAVMERMDYSKLYAAYSRLGRIEYSPKILLKIMVESRFKAEQSSFVQQKQQADTEYPARLPVLEYSF